jgi:hypothetical protein
MVTNGCDRHKTSVGGVSLFSIGAEYTRGLSVSLDKNLKQ